MKDDTLFRHVLGDSPTIRVLELFIEGRGLDYSLTDIAEGANVGWTTLHRLLPGLIDAGLVKQTRTIGRAKLYRLNLDSKAARQLVKLFDTIIAEAVPDSSSTPSSQPTMLSPVRT